MEAHHAQATATRRSGDLGIGAVCETLADAHATIGFGKYLIGRAEETEAHVVEALRLSPRDTMAYMWMFYAGVAVTEPGRWDKRFRGYDAPLRPIEICHMRTSRWPPL
jgi:hypothetical protein